MADTRSSLFICSWHLLSWVVRNQATSVGMYRHRTRQGRELGPKAHDFVAGVLRDNEVSFPSVDMYILSNVVGIVPATTVVKLPHTKGKRKINMKEKPAKIVGPYYYKITPEMNLLMWLQKLLLRATPWFLV
ncbi:hypothetical protein CTI12_AA219890 [Artemisia annua]|uniref:Uncharacterized protein n=1 Tax=Artemisia annua TaxID=35608 RepID=A0A2U1NWV5_ARTAN|nr:hypothetical protein CTI12_AA219890 [Artemisia annua]